MISSRVELERSAKHVLVVGVMLVLVGHGHGLLGYLLGLSGHLQGLFGYLLGLLGYLFRVTRLQGLSDIPSEWACAMTAVLLVVGLELFCRRSCRHQLEGQRGSRRPKSPRGF